MACAGYRQAAQGDVGESEAGQILLKADADGPEWPDVKIGEAYDCSVRTVENLRERLVTAGFDAALERKKRAMADAVQAGRRGRSEADRDAAREAAGGVWPVVVAVAGR